MQGRMDEWGHGLLTSKNLKGEQRRERGLGAAKRQRDKEPCSWAWLEDKDKEARPWAWLEDRDKEARPWAWLEDRDKEARPWAWLEDRDKEAWPWAWLEDRGTERLAPPHFHTPLVACTLKQWIKGENSVGLTVTIWPGRVMASGRAVLRCKD